ncbi:ABC transporter permease [Hansschlegelia plantiphila]|uniref:ABC transporter permease n=1 Tax=Hansschlegelia plantiphila TaxID=374655 RepID=A0A9W6J2P0_9HYPH|nr:ABC transporter permease [Hansschlegelia plantiphila]
MTAIEHPDARAPAVGDALPLRRRSGGWGRPLIGFALPVGLALLWEAAVRSGLANGRLVAPPSRIAITIVELWRSGDLPLHIWATVWRVAAGFGLGVISGTTLGALAGASVLVRQIVDPTIQGLRSVPSIAWVPLFILWLGIFEPSKIALISVGVFFPVYLGVLGAIASVDRKTIEVGRIFRLGRFALVRRILLPAILPAYALALRTGLGLGWMFVVAAEFMGASEGLGYLLVDGQQLGKPDQIIAAILIFACLGKLTDGLLVSVSAPLLRWQDTVAEQGLS